MDLALPDDGDRVLSSLDAGVEEQEKQGGGQILWVATAAKRPLVTRVFWAEISRGRALCDSHHVGDDRGDDQEVLADLAGCWVSNVPLLAVGELCHTTKRGDSST